MGPDPAGSLTNLIRFLFPRDLVLDMRSCGIVKKIFDPLVYFTDPAGSFDG